MIAAREVSVTVRRIVSGGGAGGGAIRARPSSADEQDRRRQRLGGRWPGAGEPGRMRGHRLAMEQPAPARGVVQQRRAGVAERAVQDEAGAQLGLGIGALVGERRPGPSTARRGSSARDLIRISWLAMATNADTWPMRSLVERRERVEVRVRERAEGHGEDVELAGLDQRQQQGQRPVERGQDHAGGRLGPAALAERDRRACRDSAITRPRRRAGTGGRTRGRAGSDW